MSQGFLWCGKNPSASHDAWEDWDRMRYSLDWENMANHFYTPQLASPNNPANGVVKTENPFDSFQTQTPKYVDIKRHDLISTNVEPCDDESQDNDDLHALYQSSFDKLSPTTLTNEIDSSEENTGELLDSFNVETPKTDLKEELTDDDKKTRWKKIDDERMFAILKNEAPKRNLTLPHIAKANMKDDTEIFDFIIYMKEKCGWQGTYQELHKRIQKTYKNPFDLSTREMKAVRAVAYKNIRDNQQIDWVAIIKKMPGKDEDFLRSYICDLPKVKKTYPFLKRELGLSSSVF